MGVRPIANAAFRYQNREQDGKRRVLLGPPDLPSETTQPDVWTARNAFFQVLFAMEVTSSKESLATESIRQLADQPSKCAPSRRICSTGTRRQAASAAMASEA